MDPRELIRAGRLSDARMRLIEDVKSKPADAGARTLLFQVHALLGEWEKAGRHLDVLAAQDAKRETGVQVYKNLVQAEKKRLDVFQNRLLPSFLPGAPPYFEMYRLACEKLKGGHVDEAMRLFDGVNEQIPVLSGMLNGQSFEGFGDTDVLLMFFLEAIVEERYLWIPFEKIREISIPAPKTLFDLIWAPAHITTWESLAVNCCLPVCYPESFLHEDDRVKLGRMTEWKKEGGPFSRGIGQHVFTAGDQEIGILDIRELAFNWPRTGDQNEKAD